MCSTSKRQRIAFKHWPKSMTPCSKPCKAFLWHLNSNPLLLFYLTWLLPTFLLPSCTALLFLNLSQILSFSSPVAVCIPSSSFCVLSLDLCMASFFPSLCSKASYSDSAVLSPITETVPSAPVTSCLFYFFITLICTWCIVDFILICFIEGMVLILFA